jgi:hypothetical protein
MFVLWDSGGSDCPINTLYMIGEKKRKAGTSLDFTCMESPMGENPTLPGTETGMDFET